MDDKMGLAIRKLIHFPCDGRKQLGCEYEFNGQDLRFGKETVGRGMGFYCKKCFAEFCAGRSWESAPTVWEVLGDTFEAVGFSYNFSETMRQGIFTPKGLDHGTQ